MRYNRIFFWLFLLQSHNFLLLKSKCLLSLCGTVCTWKERSMIQVSEIERKRAKVDKINTCFCIKVPFQTQTVCLWAFATVVLFVFTLLELTSFYKKLFGGHKSFLWGHWYPVLDFWWCLPWVSKLLGSQHGSRAFSMHIHADQKIIFESYIRQGPSSLLLWFHVQPLNTLGEFHIDLSIVVVYVQNISEPIIHVSRGTRNGTDGVKEREIFYGDNGKNADLKKNISSHISFWLWWQLQRESYLILVSLPLPSQLNM